MRVMSAPHLVGCSWYLHEYETLLVVELFYREVLRPHGLLENIDNIWVNIYLDVASQELIRLARSMSILGAWIPPKDIISGVWFIGILMVISMA